MRKNCIAISLASVSRYRRVWSGRQWPSPAARQDDEDTGVDNSCCEHRPVSAGDAVNALAVLREWLDCNTAGECTSFHLIAELENYIVSCAVTTFSKYSISIVCKTVNIITCRPTLLRSGGKDQRDGNLDVENNRHTTRCALFWSSDIHHLSRLRQDVSAASL